MTISDIAALIAVALSLVTTVTSITANKSRLRVIERQMAMLDGVGGSRVKKELQRDIDHRVALMLSRDGIAPGGLFLGLLLWSLLIVGLLFFGGLLVAMVSGRIHPPAQDADVQVAIIVATALMYAGLVGLAIRYVVRRIAIEQRARRLQGQKALPKLTPARFAEVSIAVTFGESLARLCKRLLDHLGDRSSHRRVSDIRSAEEGGDAS